MPKQETLKDAEYSKKLEENSKKMFGRSYRFLPADKKKAVVAETKFEPKLPEQTNNPLDGKQTQTPAQKSKVEEPKKPAGPFVDYITQWECDKKHKTNGKVTMPVKDCRICNKPVKLIGHYENDIFVPEVQK